MCLSWRIEIVSDFEVSTSQRVSPKDDTMLTSEKSDHGLKTPESKYFLEVVHQSGKRKLTLGKST